MRRIKRHTKVDTTKLTLNEILFQVSFFINNNRFESALCLMQTNEILLLDLSQNKSIKNLDAFRTFVKDQFRGEKSS